MKSIKIGDIKFTIHNKREELFLKDFKNDVEVIRNYILNPDESLSEYDQRSRVDIINFRIVTLHGKLSACFWMDIIKQSYALYSVDNFKRHFINV